MRTFWTMLGAAALVLGASAPASALSYVINDPRFGGAFIAGCPTEQYCGNGIQNSANDFCRSQGYAGASNYRTDAVRARGSAYHIATRSRCSHPNCIMFTQISCSSQAARPAPPARPPAPAYQPVRVNRPNVNGVVLDWCVYWGRNCGAQAAYFICQRLGYRGALNWATHRPGRTLVMGSNQLCQGTHCLGFSYVTCAR